MIEPISYSPSLPACEQDTDKLPVKSPRHSDIQELALFALSLFKNEQPPFSLLSKKVTPLNIATSQDDPLQQPPLYVWHFQRALNYLTSPNELTDEIAHLIMDDLNTTLELLETQEVQAHITSHIDHPQDLQLTLIVGEYCVKCVKLHLIVCWIEMLNKKLETLPNSLDQEPIIKTLQNLESTLQEAHDDVTGLGELIEQGAFFPLDSKE